MRPLLHVTSVVVRQRQEKTSEYRRCICRTSNNFRYCCAGAETLIRAALLLFRLRRLGARANRLLIGAHEIAGIDQAAPSSGASRLHERDAGGPPIGIFMAVEATAISTDPGSTRGRNSINSTPATRPTPPAPKQNPPILIPTETDAHHHITKLGRHAIEALASSFDHPHDIPRNPIAGRQSPRRTVSLAIWTRC